MVDSEKSKEGGGKGVRWLMVGVGGQIMGGGSSNIWNMHHVSDKNQGGYISTSVPLFRPKKHWQSPLTACV